MAHSQEILNNPLTRRNETYMLRASYSKTAPARGVTVRPSSPLKREVPRAWSSNEASEGCNEKAAFVVFLYNCYEKDKNNGNRI